MLRALLLMAGVLAPSLVAQEAPPVEGVAPRAAQQAAQQVAEAPSRAVLVAEWPLDPVGGPGRMANAYVLEALAMEAFDAVVPPVVSVFESLAAVAAPSEEKQLKKLVKKLGKARKKMNRAGSKVTVIQERILRVAGDRIAALELPEDTPKQAKAKAKALNKNDKQGAKLDKALLKWQQAFQLRSRRVLDITDDILSLDPDFLPGPEPDDPGFVLSPHAMSFAADEGGEAPEPQLFSIENTGATALDWAATPDAPWVSVVPGSGLLAPTAVQTVRLSVDPAGMPQGSYSSLVSVGSSTPGSPMLSLVASLDISGGTPQLQGLDGEYFDEIDLTQLADTRLDPVIDFSDWGAAPTGTAVTPDNFYSERWTGFVSIDQPGDWTFRTVSNDGVRLFVDDELVIEDWTNHAAKSDSATRTLTAGWHPIRLEHYQSDGTAVIQLYFSGPGQSETIIPATHLSPTSDGNQPPTVQVDDNPLLELPDSMVQLLALADDPDGVIASWSWSQVGGPQANIQRADTPNPLVSGLSAVGTYTFQVSVVDDGGLGDTAQATVTVVDPATADGVVSGTLRPWHRVTVDFLGQKTSEGAGNNPFLDSRLDVTFTHVASGRTYVVPGFFAADGQAAETGATGGDVWRARFTPDEPGTWTYLASFRQGPAVAISLSPTAGTPAQFDGAVGSFEVGTANAGEPGFRGLGRLEYDGTHFLQEMGTGLPFLKGGCDSPENVLAFGDFDQTPASHAFVPHLGDWQPGDPVWHGDKGKGLIGGLNYLASMGVNSLYFLTYNVGGDGDDVWPFTGKTQRLRYDVSKLAQWEIVFEHMDELGIQLHVVTQEQENDNGGFGLDSGNLGTERKLYYRELVARFGHHLALVWNLGEENTNTNAQRKWFYDHIKALDPYDHPIVVHTFPEQQASVYQSALGYPILEGPSVQNDDAHKSHDDTLRWRSESIAAGRPWVVTLDEFGPASEGVLPDSVDPTHDVPRKEALWGNLIAGGAGAEWYFGYNFPHSDLTCEDWRSRENMWIQTTLALDFFREHVPYASMAPDDDLVGPTAWCLAQPGETYLVYLKNGGSTTLDLGAATGGFSVRWFDPRNGGALQNGSVLNISGPGPKSIGTPPSEAGQDWAVLVTRQ